MRRPSVICDFAPAKFKTRRYRMSLKGPKLEIFGSKVFTLIIPVWVIDLGTRQKISNF
jgi:hypothetical protein